MDYVNLNIKSIDLEKTTKEAFRKALLYAKKEILVFSSCWSMELLDDLFECTKRGVEVSFFIYGKKEGFFEKIIKRENDTKKISRLKSIINLALGFCVVFILGWFISNKSPYQAVFTFLFYLFSFLSALLIFWLVKIKIYEYFYASKIHYFKILDDEKFNKEAIIMSCFIIDKKEAFLSLLSTEPNAKTKNYQLTKDRFFIDTFYKECSLKKKQKGISSDDYEALQTEAKKIYEPKKTEKMHKKKFISTEEKSFLSLVFNVFNLPFGIIEAFLLSIGGIFSCLTVIGIPFGIQFFKLAIFCIWPFGKKIIIKKEPSNLAMLGNILWIFFVGIWASLGELILSLILCLSIVGIPFGLQRWKVAKFIIFPFGSSFTSSN